MLGDYLLKPLPVIAIQVLKCGIECACRIRPSIRGLLGFDETDRLSHSHTI